MPISAAAADPSSGEFMLFGVRVVVDSMRKSVSLNNLSQYEQPSGQDLNCGDKSDVVAVAVGYASANDDAPAAARSRVRKRGVPWTEEEHRQFLQGLQKVGKGDWRGIARSFVKTRTPTQVASHAQKYFLRRNNLNGRRRRSSLFDITTDVVSPTAMEEEHVQSGQTNSQSYSSPPPPPESNHGFPPTSGPAETENATTQNLIRPIALHPAPSPTTIANLDSNSKLPNDPPALSLRLSMNSGVRESSSRHSQAQTSFDYGENTISVA